MPFSEKALDYYFKKRFRVNLKVEKSIFSFCNNLLRKIVKKRQILIINFMRMHKLSERRINDSSNLSLFTSTDPLILTYVFRLMKQAVRDKDSNNFITSLSISNEPSLMLRTFRFT
jgi:hypothetical protein